MPSYSTKEGYCRTYFLWTRMSCGCVPLFAASAALTFWTIESLIHTYMFHQPGLLHNLFPKDPNELCMRILISCLLIALGIYARSSFTKLKKSEEERLALQKKLEEYLQ